MKIFAFLGSWGSLILLTALVVEPDGTGSMLTQFGYFLREFVLPIATENV